MMLVAIGAVLVIGAGGWGEALVIYALYQDQAGAFTGQIVLASAVFLTIAVVAGPVLTFSKSAAETYLALLEFTRTLMRLVRTVSENARQRHAVTGTMPLVEPDAETSKTDAPEN